MKPAQSSPCSCFPIQHCHPAIDSHLKSNTQHSFLHILLCAQHQWGRAGPLLIKLSGRMEKGTPHCWHSAQHPLVPHPFPLENAALESCSLQHWECVLLFLQLHIQVCSLYLFQKCMDCSPHCKHGPHRSGTQFYIDMHIFTKVIRAAEEESFFCWERHGNSDWPFFFLACLQ